MSLNLETLHITILSIIANVTILKQYTLVKVTYLEFFSDFWMCRLITIVPVPKTVASSINFEAFPFRTIIVRHKP